MLPKERRGSACRYVRGLDASGHVEHLQLHAKVQFSGFGGKCSIKDGASHTDRRSPMLYVCSVSSNECATVRPFAGN